jgi:hypothetical protein
LCRWKDGRIAKDAKGFQKFGATCRIHSMKTTFSIIAMIVILIVVVMAKCSLDRMANQEPSPAPKEHGIKISIKP